jgi:hypothetical protein
MPHSLPQVRPRDPTSYVAIALELATFPLLAILAVHSGAIETLNRSGFLTGGEP